MASCEEGRVSYASVGDTGGHFYTPLTGQKDRGPHENYHNSFRTGNATKG